MSVGPRPAVALASNLPYLAMAIVFASGVFLYFFTRLVVELLAARAYALLLTELRELQRRQAELERAARFDARRP